MMHHQEPPMPMPAVPPSIPEAPTASDTPDMPVMPVANDPQPEVQPSVSDLNKKKDEIAEQRQKLGDDVYTPASMELCGQPTCTVMQGLRGAEMYMGIYQKTISNNEKEIERITAILEELPLDSKLREGYEKSLVGCYLNIEEAEIHLQYWTLEAERRAPLDAQIKESAEQMQKMFEEMQDLSQQANRLIMAQRVKDSEENALKATIDLTKMPSSTGEISGSDFFPGTGAGVSDGTMDISPQKSMQELREDSLREAFSDLGTLEFQTGFLEAADTVGQGAQLVVGFVPGASGADVMLSGARGFAEALGSEISKGTSWEDALKIATVNAGMKGAVSFVGNKLTAGADGMANRVAVLSEVGFAKLTTKQIAEYGAKGISFVVVKSGQAVTQEVVGSGAIDPAVKKIGDWIKSDKGQSSTTSASTSGYGSGFGMSSASQPFVAY